MSKYLFIVMACCPFICLAQREDNNWIMCAAYYPQDTFKMNHIQFTNDTFHVTLVNKTVPVFEALGIASDSSESVQLSEVVSKDDFKQSLPN